VNHIKVMLFLTGLFEIIKSQHHLIDAITAGRS
jgi:hypothetical protein